VPKHQQDRALIAGQPGDIDILALPLVDDQVAADKAFAIEVKILRPTLERPARNANRLAVS
jgi:hypothetical protein